jgi:hypothetical protein
LTRCGCFSTNIYNVPYSGIPMVDCPGFFLRSRTVLPRSTWG